MILEASTPDPGSTGIWGVAGMIVTLVVAPLVGWWITRASKPPTPATTPVSPERQRVEEVFKEATDDMSDSLVKIIARMDDRFEKQSDRLADVEGRWTEARDHVADVHDWIDDGMPSPPGRPDRPHWAPSRRTIH